MFYVFQSRNCDDLCLKTSVRCVNCLKHTQICISIVYICIIIAMFISLKRDSYILMCRDKYNIERTFSKAWVWARFETCRVNCLRGYSLPASSGTSTRWARTVNLSDQFAFRDERSMVDAVLRLRVVIERAVGCGGMLLAVVRHHQGIH